MFRKDTNEGQFLQQLKNIRGMLSSVHGYPFKGKSVIIILSYC